MIPALTSHALLIRRHVRLFIHVQKFNPYSQQTPVFNIENKCSKIVIFVIFIICSLWRPRGISQLVSGLYYATQDTGCNIHIGAKLNSLGRAKVFSSVATKFGLKTIRTAAFYSKCQPAKYLTVKQFKPSVKR